MDVKRTAEEHWAFMERWLHMVYVDSFIHGYKHGKHDGMMTRKRGKNILPKKKKEE